MVFAHGTGGSPVRPFRLALLGTRGIPARYGGFETFAEELAARLVERGHQVTVFTRAHNTPERILHHRGAALRILPALRTKTLETISHTLISVLHVDRRHFDVGLLCNAANAPLIPLLHARGIPVALNVDGLERKRRKWGSLGRAYYRLCEGVSARWADTLVTDARVIQRYYRRAWRRDSVMIPYGGDLSAPAGDEFLARFGLAPGTFLLYVSRLEPENNPDRVIASFRRVPGDRRLVVVGSAPYAPALARRVEELAAVDPRVLLAGGVYGDGYRQLLFAARVYIHATEVGGTHPALVEAMGAGRPVVFLDNPPNREVVGPAGVPFTFSDANSLDLVLRRVVDDDLTLRSLGEAARLRVQDRYLWDDVASRYEEVLEGLCSANPPGKSPTVAF